MTTQTVHIQTFDYGASLTSATLRAIDTDTLVATADTTDEVTADSGLYAAVFGEVAVITAGTYRLRAVAGGQPINRYVTLAGVDAEVVQSRSERFAELPPDGITASVLATDAVAKIADGVWDEATAGHTASGTYGGRIVRSTNSNVEVQITGSHHIAADVHEFQTGVIVAGAFAANSLTAAALAADAVTEIQSGLATSAQINSLQVNTRANLQVPIEIETPDSSTQVFKIRLFLFDVEGNMEAPDSAPTLALVNAAGTDRSSRLSVASNPSTGVYSWDYTASAGDTEEQLNWTFTVIEGGLTRVYPATSYVVEETAYRFSSADRATLNAAATQISVNDLPTNAELATALGAADDAVLAAIALEAIKTTAIKTVTDKVTSGLVQDGAVWQFTANMLELGPSGGGAPTVGQIADEVQMRTIAAVTVVNGLAVNTVTAAALAADAVTEIQSGLATSAEVAA